MPEGKPRQLWFVVDGDPTPSKVTTYTHHDIDDLKKTINAERKDLPVCNMILWKVNIPIPVLYHTQAQKRALIEGIRKIHFPDRNSDDAFECGDVQLLIEGRDVSDYWKEKPTEKQVNVLVLPVERPAKRRRIEREDEVEEDHVTSQVKPASSDHTSAGLTELWNRAWGQNSKATLFKIREVDRDGTLPDICAPKTCMVLDVPENILKQFLISTILIRQEYVTALKFAIFIAWGGRPSDTTQDEIMERVDTESQNESSLAMQLNPFTWPNVQDAYLAGAVAFLGHPGIGKTLFLFYVLACRMLASLPSIYMDKLDCVYIVDSSGVRKTDVQALHRVSITNKYWCLVDSNTKLDTVPADLLTLGFFIIQSASPHNKRIDWWTKYPRPLRRFFMKEWTLSELIIGRTLQQEIIASERDLKTFLDRFVPSAREVFAYAADQFEYETYIKESLSRLGKETISKILNDAWVLNFDHSISHHLVLITPSETSRSRHLVRISTKFLYDQITSLDRTNALGAAFLLHEAYSHSQTRDHKMTQAELDSLVSLPEPHRCHDWMKTMFVVKRECEILQVDFWNMYNDAFSPFTAQYPLLLASDFINKVTNVFPQARLMAVPGPGQRYIIRGIQKRSALWQS